MDLHHHFRNGKGAVGTHVEGVLSALVKLTLGEALHLWSDTLTNAPPRGFFTVGARDDVDELFN
jgi:hypothetical protein